MWMLNGLHRFVWFSGLRVLTVLANAVGLLVLAVRASLTVRNAIFVYLFGLLLTALAAGVLLGRLGPSHLAVDLSLVKGLFRFGLKSHISSVGSMLNERMDQLVISVFLPPQMLGLYVTAVTLTSGTAIVGSSISLVAMSPMARLSTGLKRTELARSFVTKTIAGSTLISIPVIVFTPLLINLTFGARYLPALPVARLLLVAVVILNLNRVFGAILRGADRPADPGIGELIGLGVTAIGLAALLPIMGLMGAALVSLLAYLVTLVWLARSGGRALDCSPGKLLSPDWQSLKDLFRRLDHRKQSIEIDD
jgi:O-antigen/teichoic acid export membrane protein